MKHAVKVLLVGAITTTLFLFGMAVAGASVPGPVVAASVAPSVAPSVGPSVATTGAPSGVTVSASSVLAAAKHAGLRCRSHAAESKPVSGKVVVPTSYCYDPDTTNHTGWHDYCTHAPDQYTSLLGTADFRGPCARHDMCLQSSHSHSKCDGPLLSNLKQNCKQRFGTFNPARYDCETVAYTYYLAIKAYTLVS